MKFNDPFGRVERRHQIGYESMRDTMRRSGIKTPQAAREIIRQSKKRSLKFLGVTMVLLLSVIYLVPKAMPMAFALALLLLIWVASSAVNGRNYIQRYIDEELKGVGNN